MQLHRQEEEWITFNIKQRRPKCGTQRQNRCELCDKCQGLLTEHANTEYDLHIGTVPCDTYGNLTFENNTPGGKYIRMDVDTDMSLVKHLLLNIWRVPKPSWIISIIGEKEQNMSGVDAFQRKLKKFLKSSFSNNDVVWVTSDGLTYGLSEKVGETVSSCGPNIVPIGIHAWGNITDVLRVKMNEPIPNDPTEEHNNMPNHYCKFSIFPDDGVYTQSSLKFYQYFRIQLEKMMAQHDKAALSIPYVTMLFGGQPFVIDGVKRSIEENIPIIVLKGTGGIADVLASVYEFGESTETKVYERGQIKWTGTLIDERLRKKLKREIQDKITMDPGEEERWILECLQKRELITVFSCDNDNTDYESSLLHAVFEALLKSMTQAEKYRLVDFYMPKAIRIDSGAALTIPELFLCQLFEMDEAECVEFILDNRGLDIVKFLTKKMIGTRFLEATEHNKFLRLQCLQPEEESASGSDQARDNTMADGNESLELQRLQLEEEYASVDSGLDTSIDMTDFKMAAFNLLFDRTMRDNKTKCCALFWKKGENLLTSALKASSELYKKASKAEKASEKKELLDHGRTFRGRAIGLINQCYKKDKEQTIDLMQEQSDASVEDHLSLALKNCNRRIFGTDAYKEYIERVWKGKIQPKVTKTPPEARSESPETVPETSCPRYEKARRNFLIRLTSPRMKFSLNLAFYIIFLALFGYLLMKLRQDGNFQKLALAAAVWWFSLVVEEIRQVHSISTKVKDNTTRRERFIKSGKYHFENYWNIWDLICLSLFFIGAVLIVVGHIDPSNSNVFDAGRLILDVDWMFSTWRILQYLAMWENLGLVLEMLRKMLGNLLPFLAIMVVFILAQGLAAQVMLYPGSVLSFDFFIKSLKMSFFSIFGELFMDVIGASEDRGECTTNHLLYRNGTMEQCPSKLGSYAVPFVMALYMILMNVLLLNIIIAKFNDTFEKILSEAEWLAAWHQARVTLEFYEKKLPPPFILLHLFYIPIKKLMEYCKKAQTDGLNSDGTDQKKQQILAWERTMAELYLTTLKNQSGSNRTLGHAQSVDENRADKKVSRVLEEIGEMKKELANLRNSNKEETSPLKLEAGGASSVEKQLSRILEVMDEFKTELASVKSKIK